MSESRRQSTCTNHCVACGSHFSSLGAFDAHRKGEPGGRWCDEPDDVPRLAAKSNHGRCDLAAPAFRVNGVTIWSLGSDLEGPPAPWQPPGAPTDGVEAFYAGLRRGPEYRGHAA
jgi:hypothetical protein